MKSQRPDDPKFDSALDREIEALLAVNPRAGFENRVRARVAQEPIKATWRFRPTFVAAVATAFAAVVALVVFWPGGTQLPEPATRVAVAHDAAPLEPAKAPEVRPPATHLAPESAKRRTTANSELLIPAAEARAIRRLINGQFGPLPASVSDALRVTEGAGELGVPQIAIKPVEVPAPITVEAIDVSPAITEEGV
jgi:hypothetical protein